MTEIHKMTKADLLRALDEVAQVYITVTFTDEGDFTQIPVRPGVLKRALTGSHPEGLAASLGDMQGELFNATHDGSVLLFG